MASNSSIVPYQSASLGQTDAHIGLSPSLVRSVHMSHFIIWSISAMYFGTPNGQASTQFEQPMQRGFNADCTMPFSVCLIASAGHTSAHVGSSQCMHTIGAVWVVVRAVDGLEVDQRPAPVRAAFFARLHARLAADAPALVDHEDRCVVGPVRHGGLVQVESERRSSLLPSSVTRTAATLNSGIFEVGSTAQVGELVRGLAPGQW